MTGEEALNLICVALDEGWSIQHCYRQYTDGSIKLALRRSVRVNGPVGTRKLRESYEVVRAEAPSLVQAIAAVTSAAFEGDDASND